MIFRYASLGDVSVDTMIAEAKDSNAAMTWALRFVGFAMIWIGGCCCLMYSDYGIMLLRFSHARSGQRRYHRSAAV